MAHDTAQLKKKLDEEKTRLEGELSTVGKVNPENPADWEATAEDINIVNADPNERADSITDFEGRSAVEVELENRYKEVTEALKRMEDGTYGMCETCENEIEEDRLNANPAARTCKAHMG